MHIPASPIGTKAIDIEGKGPTAVQFLKADFHYPLLARWEATPAAKAAIAGETVQSAIAQPIHRNRPTVAVANHFIAHLQSPEDLTQVFQILRRDDLQVRQLSAPGVYRIGPNPSGPDAMAEGKEGDLLAKLPDLRAALGPDAVEPDYLYFVSQTTPDDEDFGLQAGLQTIGAPQFWDFKTGSEDVKVAIIDTGVDLQHPDLYENLQGKDKTLIGYDFYNGKPDPDDDHGHGTFCAGLIGARGNNKTGIAGVNWVVKILPIKAFNALGVGTSSHSAMAVDFAVKNGANVILCAWGSAARSRLLEDALKRAHEAGVLVIAAAGNEPINLDEQDHFPASFDLPNIISVGGSDENDEPVLDWGHGKQRVHLSAPGMQVYSTVPTRFRPSLPYDRNSGTSPAAALVAGACALLKAQYPQDSHLQIRQRLLQAGARKPNFQGASAEGRLDLANALPPPVAPAPALPRELPGSRADGASSPMDANP